jgi:hypothetical protein
VQNFSIHLRFTFTLILRLIKRQAYVVEQMK